MTTSVQPCSQAYTLILPAPTLTSVPILGVSSPASTESMPSGESLTMVMESQDIAISIPKHLHIISTLVHSSDSPVPSTNSTSSDLSTRSVSYPVVVVPELTILAEAYPECLNRPGGGKEYLCHLCAFRHSNQDCILTHIKKHLDITIGCPVCRKGYQKVASLCKHGRDAHNVQIVASSDFIPTEAH